MASIFDEQKIETKLRGKCICSNQLQSVRNQLQSISSTNMASYNNSNSNRRDGSSSSSNGRGYGGAGKYIPRDAPSERDNGHHDHRDVRRDDRHDDRRDDRRDGGNYDSRDDRRDDRRDNRHSLANPSICIPRTFPTIRGEQTKRAVFNTIKELQLGHIERIDVVHKTDSQGQRYCTIYIHLKWNMRNELAVQTRDKLLGGEDVKIVYDEPWFWKCTMSTMDKPADRNLRSAPRPRIDLGEGVAALSRHSRDDDREEQSQHEEHPNENQLCNMDPEED